MLTVQHARVSHDAVPQNGEFIGQNQFSPSDLPTVMRKAFDLTR
jgi:A/G-specific adenine glycosylase